MAPAARPPMRGLGPGRPSSGGARGEPLSQPPFGRLSRQACWMPHLVSEAGAAGRRARRQRQRRAEHERDQRHANPPRPAGMQPRACTARRTADEKVTEQHPGRHRGEQRAAALLAGPATRCTARFSESAPATSQEGSHCGASRPRTVRSLNTATLPATVPDTIPAAGAGRPRGPAAQAQPGDDGRDIRARRGRSSHAPQAGGQHHAADAQSGDLGAAPSG